MTTADRLCLRLSPCCLGFFPGSTIGNLTVPAAVDLLRALAATLGAGSMLLIDIDRIKDQDILLPAYDDTQGLTAAFNPNLLHRINRELRGSIPLSTFRHVARWNDVESRIEMHLEAARDVRFEISGRTFSLMTGRPSTRRIASNTGEETPLSSCKPADGIPLPIGRMMQNSSPSFSRSRGRRERHHRSRRRQKRIIATISPQPAQFTNSKARRCPAYCACIHVNQPH
ncbi:hypothetical protein ACVWWG_006258 [Bradyrhizobium sp. LB7.2]